MHIFTVGAETHILDGYATDCTVLEVDEAGLNIFYNYASPTAEELKNFDADASGEIRMARINGVLFLFCRLGTSDWAEMPYAIQLSKATNLPEPEHGQGYSLTIVLIDRKTSIVKKIRMIGLSTDFSRAFKTEIMKDAKKPLIAPEYYAKVRDIQETYPTWVLADKSKVGYKFGAQ